MLCRFEDRLAGTALEMEAPCGRIEARAAHELESALARIEAERARGRWVALLAAYELGEWLEPSVAWADAATGSTGTPCGAAGGAPGGPAPRPPAATRGGESCDRTDDGADAGGHEFPRLTALVFERARRTVPWPAGDASAAGILEATPGIDAARHAGAVEEIRERIAHGEVYQVNYTFPMRVRAQGDPAALYRALAARHPSAHAAFIQDGRRSVLSFSPELFVRRRGATLTCRPMKGTAPRHPDPAEDERLGRELLASVKNRAENLMIVDLLRNDLGRLAAPGSVRVENLFALERYPSVWTLTSTIHAEAPQAGLEDILRALFPCGSVTGAPKIAAMRRIRALEAAPRGLYCGSLGWLAPDGDFSLNVAIRTLVLEHGADAEGGAGAQQGAGTDASGPAGIRHGIYGVGGGIVIDSDPGLEWRECQWKSRIVAPGSLAFA